MYHRFIRRVSAVFVRVHPKTWYGWISMRIEFFGCSGTTTPLTRRFSTGYVFYLSIRREMPHTRICIYIWMCGLSLLKKESDKSKCPVWGSNSRPSDFYFRLWDWRAAYCANEAFAEICYILFVTYELPLLKVLFKLVHFFGTRLVTSLLKSWGAWP